MSVTGLFSHVRLPLLDAELGEVVLLREVVAAVDEAVAAVYDHLVAADEVGRRVELLLLERHAWVVRHDGLLGELLPSEHEGVGVFAGILLPDLLDLDGVVREVVVERVVVDLPFDGLVVPDYVEGKHLPVVLQVLVEAAVGMAASELDLEVLLVLLGVGRVDFDVFDFLGNIEIISGQLLRQGERLAHVLEKLSGVLVAVADAEHLA